MFQRSSRSCCSPAALAIYLVGIWVIAGFMLHFIHVSSPPPNVDEEADEDPDEVPLLTPTEVTLTWHTLTYSVPGKGNNCMGKCKCGKGKGKGKDKASEDKVLLNAVSGIARPGTMTALMGPSGAGKTTLLDVLAGVMPVLDAHQGCA